jgi:predicted RNA polymerase sigma factor
LAKLGRVEEARAELLRAASLTQNARQRDLLLARAAELASGEVAAHQKQKMPLQTP